jgi:hypothetical protein
MDWILGIAIGIGLAAACGFRIFVPPLVLSVAGLSGHLVLAPGFQWMGTWTALTAFAVATALEIAGYYIPWVDNLLDTAATPIAVVAGVVTAASCITDMSPLLKWTLAVIAGGGAAGLVQILTVKTRALSSLFTGGLANGAVSTVETVSSTVLSVLVVLIPLLALILLIMFLAAALWWVTRERPAARRG